MKQIKKFSNSKVLGYGIALSLFALGSFWVQTKAQEANPPVELPNFTVSEGSATPLFFSDVQNTHPKFAPAKMLSNIGIINGYDDGTLRLEQDINRAEFVKILLESKKKLDSSVVIEYDPAFAFPDVPEDAWYAGYVSTAKKMGIIQGYPDGTFKPGQTINYPEAYKIIINSLQISLDDSNYLPPTLADQADQWFSPFVSTVAMKNLSPELAEIQNIEDFSKNISRGAAFDALYRSYTIAADPSSGKDVTFHDPDFFFGDNDGLIQTPFQAPYYLPIAYRGKIDNTINGTLYKMSIDTFLKTQMKKDDDPDCCIIHRDLRYHLPAGLTAEMTEISRFQTEVKQIPNQEEGSSYQRSYIAIPITEPGIYALRVDSDQIPEEDIILIPSNFSMEKRSGENQSLIWVVDSKQSKPVAEAVVKGYDLTGDFPKEVLVTTTDQNGLAIPEKITADILVASTVQDFTVLKTGNYGSPFPIPFEPLMMADGAAQNTPDLSSQYKIFAYTDRPIYRPDNLVQFKGIVRRDNHGIYSMPDVSEVRVTISNYHNSGENIIYEENLKLSEYGTFASEVLIDPEMGTGSYYIKTLIGETVFDVGNFEVESYKKQEYEILLHADKEAVVQGENITIDINGMYFFGQPLINQEVSYTIYKNQSYPIMPYADFGVSNVDAPMYKIMPPGGNYGNEVFDSGKLTLDSSGTATLIFETDEEADFINRQYSVEISITDESNIPVRKRINVEAYASTIDLEITGPYQGQINKNFRSLITTKDHDDNRLANIPLGIRVERNGYETRSCGEYFDIWQRSYLPQPCYDYKTELVFETEEKTNARGEFELEFVPKKGGNYRLEVIATDGQNHKVKSEFQFTIYGAGLQSNANYVSVSTDKEIYQIGDIAVMSADTSIKSGLALVTFAKADIYKSEVIAFDNYHLDAAAEVGADTVPGFTVYVDILDNYNFSTGSAEATVYPAKKKLNVSLLPGKEKASPGEAVSWVVLVKDEDDRPVQGEISLALVDKSIFEIRSHNLDQVFEQFYQRRYYYIEQETTQMQQLENVPYDRIDMPFAIMEEDMMLRDQAAQPPNAEVPATEAKTGASGADGTQIVRELFADTGAWVAQVVTNSEGIGRVDVNLPHNLTTWIGLSVAVTKDTEIGFGTADILVKKDLVLQPFVPRFVTVGDDVTFRANVHNYLASSANFQILGRQICSSEFASDGCKEGNLADHYFREITSNDYRPVSWSYTVPDYFRDGDVLELKFTVEQENQDTINDQIIMRVPVKGRGVKKTNSESGEGNASIGIKAESGNIQNIQKILVHLSPTLTENLVKSLEYLTGFPYGCTEQTMSRFLPNIVAWQARDTLSFGNTRLFDELPEQTRVGLQRLYRFQHHDGGWGWWQDDESTDKNTAYVMFGLTLAKNAGFEVDKNVFAQGVRYLETSLSSTDFVKYHPYILAILSMIEAKAQYKDFGKLFLDKVDYKTLQAIDLAYMIEWESHYNEKKYTPALVAEIERRLKTAGNTLYLEEEVIDYELMGSSQLSTAVVAATFAKLNIKPDLTEKMIRWLDQSRDGYAYHETHATSHAVIALVEFLKNNPENSGGANSYNVKINGSTVNSGELTGMRTLEIDPTGLQADSNQLTIEKTGGGKIYYTYLMTEFLPEGSGPDGFNNGFKVITRYLDADNNEVPSFDVGDIVKIDVAVEAAQDSHYVLGKIPLPAGLEAINPKLEGYNDFYYGGYFSNEDIYDDHIAVFMTQLSKGTYNYSFNARAVTPGTFQVNPTVVEMMYAPEVNGASASGEVRVK